jgi:hypothetical protein
MIEDMSMTAKRLTVIATVIAMAVLTWWSTHRWLSQEGQFADWRLYLLPLLLGILYAAAAGLALALLRSRWDRIAVITTSWAVFVVFFPASIWYLSALPVFLAFWMEASRRNQQERDERRRLRAHVLVGAGTRFLLLGIFLMVSLGFYSLRTNGELTLDVVTRGVQQRVDNAYENDLIRNRLADVPASLQSQFRQDLAEAIESFVERWLGPVAPYLPPIFALALFLGLWSSVSLVRLPVLWIAGGLFLLMRKTGFVTVTEEDVKREIVVL